MMRTSRLLAAGFLGVGFAWVSYVASFVEPDMGFVTLPADFFDARKVAEGYASSVWLVSNLIHLVFPVAIMAIVYSADDRLLTWVGAGSSLLWLVVGAVDRIGIELRTLQQATRQGRKTQEGQKAHDVRDRRQHDRRCRRRILTEEDESDRHRRARDASDHHRQ